MRDTVEACTLTGSPLKLTLQTADVITHAYFSVKSEEWLEVREAVRVALARAVQPFGTVVRGDGTGEP